MYDIKSRFSALSARLVCHLETAKVMLHVQLVYYMSYKCVTHKFNASKTLKSRLVGMTKSMVLDLSYIRHIIVLLFHFLFYVEILIL